MANPYQPPIEQGAAPRPGVELERLRKIATYQRLINLAILAQIVAGIVLAMAPIPPALAVLIRALLFIVVAIGSVVAEVLLANALHSTLVAALCAPLMFVPCVNLIVLLVFNQQATGRLRDAGYKVGLLGGNPDDIR